MDYLTSTSECVEDEFFSSYTYRRQQAKNSKNGLGPPDLCHIHKMNPQTKSQTNSGFYHLVHGLRVESVSSVATYFARLLLTQPGQESKKNKKKQWQIKVLTFVSYNAFQKEDLLVKLTLPNQLFCYSLDSNDKETQDPPPNFWKGIMVSSFLRWNQLRNGPHSRLFFDKWLSINLVDDYIVDPQPQILESALIEMIRHGSKLGTDRLRTVPTISSNKLVDGYLKFLFQQQRYTHCIKFFKRLSQLTNEPEFLWAVARCYRAQSNLENAKQILEKALKKRPFSFSLNKEYLKTLSKLGKYKQVVRIVKKLETLFPFMPQTFLLSAKISLNNQNFNRTLIAINKCPFDSLGGLQDQLNNNGNNSKNSGSSLGIQNINFSKQQYDVNESTLHHSKKKTNNNNNENYDFNIIRVTCWNGRKSRIGSKAIIDELDDLYSKDGVKYLYKRSINFNYGNNQKSDFNNTDQNWNNENNSGEFLTNNFYNQSSQRKKRKRKRKKKRKRERNSEELNQFGVGLFLKNTNNKLQIVEGLPLKIYKIFAHFFSKVTWKRIVELRDEVFLENVRDSGVKKGIVKVEFGSALGNKEWEQIENEIQNEKSSDEQYNDEWESQNLVKRNEEKNTILNQLQTQKKLKKKELPFKKFLNGYDADNDGIVSSDYYSDDDDDDDDNENMINNDKKNNSNTKNDNDIDNENDKNSDDIKKEKNNIINNSEEEVGEREEKEKEKEKEKGKEKIKKDNSFNYRSFHSENKKKTVKKSNIGYQKNQSNTNTNKNNNDKIYQYSEDDDIKKKRFTTSKKKINKAPEPEIIPQWQTYTYQEWLANILNHIYHDSSTLSVLKLEENNLQTSGLTFERTIREWEEIGNLALKLEDIEMAEESFYNTLKSKKYENEINITANKTDSLLNLIKINLKQNKFTQAIIYCNLMFNFITTPQKYFDLLIPEFTLFHFKITCFELICKCIFIKGAIFLKELIDNYPEKIIQFEDQKTKLKKNLDKNKQQMTNNFQNNFAKSKKKNNNKNKKKKKKKKKSKKMKNLEKINQEIVNFYETAMKLQVDGFDR
ncbi:bud site selection protein 7-related [Anaeramoeba flamelloides]|uniref:Bud site selection protein 7-related n=1 Tax=Anaeramoeba flamelloides TaxID=1746091 RepID=A0AAV8A5L4_9EUKA|nr:bud site selection protein 7-related [Anaeramoeba flamelloides]